MSRRNTIGTEKKRLLILGGGMGGLPLALKIEKDKKLSSYLDVTLVDKKEYFEINLASVRFLVDSTTHASYTALYSTYLKTTRFVRGEVRAVHAEPKQVEVDTGGATENLAYDYLVIALGTRYAFFKAEHVTLQQRSEEVATHAQRVAAARQVLIVGGRSVGLEILGEIVERFPDKDVTIVHPMETLMDGWPKSGVNKLNKFLAGKKRVTVVLGKKVVRSEGTTHELSDGTSIEADIKILATGVAPNSEALRQFFGPALTPSGYVKVQKTLQVEGFPHVFAIGDIADLDMPKMAANLKAHVDLTLKNLQALVQNKKTGVVGAPMMPFPGLVTLGPSNAILALPMFGGSSFSGKFLSNMKTNLFTKMAKNPAS